MTFCRGRIKHCVLKQILTDGIAGEKLKADDPSVLQYDNKSAVRQVLAVPLFTYSGSCGEGKQEILHLVLNGHANLSFGISESGKTGSVTVMTAANIDKVGQRSLLSS